VPVVQSHLEAIVHVLKKFGSLVACIAILVQAGCATIMGGPKQIVAIDSTPDGAVVTSARAGMAATIDYTTPATVTFERKGHYILTFSKDGYDSKQVELLRSIRGWMLVWDIVWFPVGIVVDAITGAWYRIEPEQVTVTLRVCKEITDQCCYVLIGRIV
jgi:hypothetical protein